MSEQLPSFQLKGGMLPLTTLELLNPQLELFATQLKQTTAQAPEFFRDAPIVLSLDRLPHNLDKHQLDEIASCLQQHGLHLVGIRSDDQHQIDAARARQLPIFPLAADKNSSNGSDSASKPQAGGLRAPKIIQQPVRGGQQIYARDSDLIILAAVNSGAEVLADGNIHVYGPLRGRAAAGVSGNPDARIFCQQLQADMLSIAGNYKVAEELRKLPLWGESTQIFLQEQQLHIQKL